MLRNTRLLFFSQEKYWWHWLKYRNRIENRNIETLIRSIVEETHEITGLFFSREYNTFALNIISLLSKRNIVIILLGIPIPPNKEEQRFIMFGWPCKMGKGLIQITPGISKRPEKVKDLSLFCLQDTHPNLHLCLSVSHTLWISPLGLVHLDHCVKVVRKAGLFKPRPRGGRGGGW